jgi:hypothetical protein
MKTQQSNYDTVTLIVAGVYILFTLLIQAITWLLQRNRSSWLTQLATNPSLVTKLNSSSNQKLTTIQTMEVSPSPVISTRTNVEPTATTGSQAVVTTPKKRRPSSKAGTTSRASKTSKSGPSTQSVSRQVKTRSSRTTPTAGLGFST